MKAESLHIDTKAQLCSLSTLWNNKFKNTALKEPDVYKSEWLFNVIILMTFHLTILSLLIHCMAVLHSPSLLFSPTVGFKGNPGFPLILQPI